LANNTITTKKISGYGQKHQLAMKVKNFFVQHPVFTTSEFTKSLGSGEATNKSTRDNLLAYYVNKGNLLRVKQGLYVVVPPDITAADYPADPYLLASKMSKDAVLAYHTALDFHSKSYSVYNKFLYLTKYSVKDVSFRNYQFTPVRTPKSLLDQGESNFGVMTSERNGMEIRVTSLERTLVDLFDKPSLGGGWEEIWRSLESVEFYNVNEVIEYALLLKKASTIAKVGYFLERNAERLFVSGSDLQLLKKAIPKQPHYMDKKLKGSLVKQWNLIVPEKIHTKTWGEVL
jgi:predicted transcriptional regulator of viral defense system